MRFQGAGAWLGVLSLAATLTAYGQKSSGGGTSSGAGAGTVGRAPSGNVGTQTTTPPGSQFPGNNQPVVIFLSGRVMTDDGTPVSSEVRIERVCGTWVHLESHVDSKGHFAFQVGANNALDVDASTEGSGNRPGGAYSPNTGAQGIGTSSRLGGMGRNGLSGCELRASYSGYHSDAINLAGREMMDNPDVGTIVLHHLGKVDGTSTSLTTLSAPKPARKLYEKGVSLAAKGKLEEAGQHFSEATSEYPAYAVAWFALGQVAEKQAKWEAAAQAFESAIKADSHYVSPYDQRAFVAAQQSDWQAAADFSRRAIGMNPVEFPGSFWYDAVANFNLKHLPEAEKSARALVKLDTQHQFPGAEKLLAQLLMDKGEYLEAATHVRAYLSAAPSSQDAAAMHELLTQLEQRAVVRAQ